MINKVGRPLKESGISYSGLHTWLIRTYGRAKYCENDKTHKSKRFEWANISGEYKRNISDYKQLCTSCHHKFDKIIAKRPRDMYTRGAETKKQNRFKKKGAIKQFNKQLVLVGEFLSLLDASKATNISSTAIHNALNGRSKTSGGYIWK